MTLKKDELAIIWKSLPRGAIQEIAASCSVSRITIFNTLSGEHINETVIKACFDYLEAKSIPIRQIKLKHQIQTAA